MMKFKYLLAYFVFIVMANGCAAAPAVPVAAKEAEAAAEASSAMYSNYSSTLYNQLGGTSTNQSNIGQVRDINKKNFCKVNPGSPSCK